MTEITCNTHHFDYDANEFNGICVHCGYSNGLSFEEWLDD